METLLGKWYALDAARYYRIIGKEISYYKLYVHKIEGDKFWYDSFIQFSDGSVESLKVDKESLVASLKAEIASGMLIRKKNTLMKDIRTGAESIAAKYGLNVVVEAS